MIKYRKILFISNRGLLPIKDGHTRRSYNILKGLAKNYQVYYLSLYESPEEIETENLKDLESFCYHVEFLPAPSKKLSIQMLVRLMRSLVSKEAYSIWRHYSISLLTRVNKLIQSEEISIVHCDILPLAYTVRNRNDIFRSITDHDVSYLKCWRMGKESRNIPLKLFLYYEAIKLRRLEKNIFKYVDLGITVSELDKKILHELCPDGRYAVIENGVDTETFKPMNLDYIRNTLVWVGGFDHYSNKQGIYFFLENIYPKIKKLKPEVTIDIIGSGVTDKLISMTSKDKSITLHGYVDDPIPLINKASVFIVPILSGGGTRLKVLEAMSLGKAIVTTSIGCEGIDGENDKHYIIADSADDFAKSVVRILLNCDLQYQLGRNARKLAVEKYDWQVIINKLAIIYKEVKA